MYGYRIENGEAVIDEQEAAVVIQIFNGYISGMSLQNAARNAGKEMVHSTVKRIIRNKCYSGDNFFPAIISRQTFAKANAELIRRSEKHGGKKRLKPPSVFKEFMMSESAIHFEDPVQQAEYMYSLVEVKL